MIIYFSGTGNSLAISRQIADSIDDCVMPLAQAVKTDLTAEKRIGLVYPSYDFNAPPAVRQWVPQLKISKSAYVFIIIPCGAQTGNAIWTIRKVLKDKGIRLAYAHKIRVPDNSAIAFGRNPNDQSWKFDRFASRLRTIISDIKAEKHAYRFSGWSLAGWIMGRPAIEKKLLSAFRPVVNETKCIGCRICSRVCPMNNIAIVARPNPSDNLSDSVARIQSACTECLGCVHACPQQAVELTGKSTLKDHQYRHPQVKISDMMLR